MSTGKTASGVWEQAAAEADLTVILPGGVPMFFRRIPAGRFRMGQRGESGREEPVHLVVVPREFLLGTFVVTQEQYRAVAKKWKGAGLKADPSDFKGPRRPVEQVSWEEAVRFCGVLEREWAGLETVWKAGQEGVVRGVRLPCEAEWEYACRGQQDGTGQVGTDYYNGDGEAALAAAGWYDKNSGKETHPVDEAVGGVVEAHPFGLYGMHGNVWEWCQDVFDPAAYRKRVDGWEAGTWTFAQAGKDAHTLDRGEVTEANATRVLRGGSWFFDPWYCRSAYRDRDWPDARDRIYGFRVCLVCGPAAGTEGTARAEPGAGDGGRGTRPESDAAGGARRDVDLSKGRMPRAHGVR